MCDVVRLQFFASLLHSSSFPHASNGASASLGSRLVPSPPGIQRGIAHVTMIMPRTVMDSEQEFIRVVVLSVDSSESHPQSSSTPGWNCCLGRFTPAKVTLLLLATASDDIVMLGT